MNCASCRFAYSERMQGQIVTQLVCKWGPPQISLVAVPPGMMGPNNPGGISGQTMFPIVQPSQFCHQYAPKARPLGDPDTVECSSDRGEHSLIEGD